VKYFKDYRRKVAARTITGLGDQAYYDGYASISVLKGTPTSGSRSAWPVT
jgi:hypothetical protein